MHIHFLSENIFYDSSKSNPGSFGGLFHKGISDVDSMLKAKEPCETPDVAHLETVLQRGLSDMTSVKEIIRIKENIGEQILCQEYTDAASENGTFLCLSYFQTFSEFSHGRELVKYQDWL